MTVYLGIGSNLGDRRRHVRNALRRLRAAGLRLLKVSSWYDTAPAGERRQGRFLNGVVKADTSLKPSALLDLLKKVEREMGRQPGKRWGPRLIDFDILLYGRKILRTRRLTIPHPRMYERGFVLIPLSELYPLSRLPGLRRVSL